MLTRYDATLPTHIDGQKHGTLQTNSRGVLLTAPAAGSDGSASATGTQSSVSDSASDGTILAANTSRKGAVIFNDSTEILYVLLAAGTSSTTNFSVKIAAGGYYEMPYMPTGCYTGIIKGIWANNSTGAARVTEFT